MNTKSTLRCMGTTLSTLEDFHQLAFADDLWHKAPDLYALFMSLG